jgi:hypothetical protein
LLIHARGATASRAEGVGRWRERKSASSSCPHRRPSHRPVCITWENAPGWGRGLLMDTHKVVIMALPYYDDDGKCERFPVRRRLAVTLESC